MPLPSEMNINQLITEFALRFSNLEYAADRVLPGIKVKKTDGKYATYDKDSFRTGGLRTLSSDTEVARTTSYGVGTATFSTELYRQSEVIGVLARENADQPFDPEQDATANLMELLAVDKEVRMATLVFGSGNYATGNKTAVANSNAWANYTTATGAKGPVFQVYSAAEVIRGKVARMPNVLVLGAKSPRVLIRHPDVKDSLKFVQALTKANVEAALAALFGVDEYIVVRAIKNIALPGETDSLSDVVADDAALIVRPARMTVKTVAHSAQFQHRLFPNGDKWVEKSRMNATVVEVRDNYVFKSVSTSAGYLFKTTNT